MALMQTFALTAVVLEFKMLAIALVQGRGRVSTGLFEIPEDAKLFHGKFTEQEAPIVDRASRAWRNDLENIPIFLILAGIYVAAGLSGRAFAWYCGIFTVMRILHTYTYIKGIQPWRTVVYTIGLFAMIAMMIHILIGVVFA
ncbi:MAG TPA: MAPEG family protein [Candidatus Binataceae bacterium]|nr:MAPEG family protein [Candidatus Binataceae bacterium]